MAVVRFEGAHIAIRRGADKFIYAHMVFGQGETFEDFVELGRLSERVATADPEVFEAWQALVGEHLGRMVARYAKEHGIELPPPRIQIEEPPGGSA